MKTSLAALAVLASLSLNGCNDDKEVTPECLEAECIKLDNYVESFYVPSLEFVPQSKVMYEYSKSGRIKKYTVFSYDPDADEMTAQRYYSFDYSGANVSRITGYSPGQVSPFVEYTYEYLSGNEVAKIREQNHSAETDSEATFTYAEDGAVKVTYVTSNGNQVEYQFDYTSGNILSDRTTRGADLCRTGEYSYDSNRNPFNHLGYVDYMLLNVSANNRLTENVNYIACEFPNLIVESYDYEYDENGYPVSATTFYKSESAVAKSKKEFYYRQP